MTAQDPAASPRPEPKAVPVSSRSVLTDSPRVTDTIGRVDRSIPHHYGCVKLRRAKSGSVEARWGGWDEPSGLGRLARPSSNTPPPAASAPIAKLPATWALATRDGDQQVVMMVNAGDGSSIYAELVLDPVFRAFWAIRSTSSR